MVPMGSERDTEAPGGFRRLPRGTLAGPERHHRRSREAHRGSREAPSQAVAPTKAHFIHEMGLICGQAAAISFRVHKRYPFCGQKPTPGTGLPQKAHSAWTGGCYFLSASTKDTLFVDKSPLRAPNFHKKHPVRGQAVIS